MGGGTASLLSARQVGDITDLAKRSFRTAENIEITLEGNPSDFGRDYYAEIIEHGVNRLSIGYQSADAGILNDKLGSPHNAEEGLRSLEDALRAGFRTVNVDMLYGIPGQRFDQWKKDVEIVVGMGPESVTTYAYIVYEKTVAALRIKQGRFEAQIDGDERHRWYLYTEGAFEESGYIAYKKGHFVRPGHAQAYSDLSYRMGAESIGIGAGAYGFINRYLFMSTSNPIYFAASVESGLFTTADFQSARANTDIMMSKYLMHSIATGTINVQEFTILFGTDPSSAYREVFDEMYIKRLAVSEKNQMKLTDLGVRWQQNITNAFYSEGLRRNVQEKI